MEVNLAEKKFSDQSKSTIGSTSTISSTQTASDLNGKTKPEDQGKINFVLVTVITCIFVQNK